MRSLLLFLLYSCLLGFSSAAGDTLKVGQNITDGESTNLVSVGEKFELGFFSPSSGSSKKYLGIWYHRLTVEAEGGSEQQRTFVWVANRKKPIVDSTGVFRIAEDGNLQVLSTEGRLYWSSSELAGTSTKNGSVKLMDSGNLVLANEFGKTVWQSFEHPTDTFLPGMKMDRNLELTSWKSLDDPASGSYTFKRAETGDNRYIILKNQQQELYWESGTPISGALPPKILYLLTNFTFTASMYRVFKNKSIVIGLRQLNYQNNRMVMSFEGKIQLLDWDTSNNNWTVQKEEPVNDCQRYNPCGNFSSCNINNRIVCKCLPGFKPRLPEKWDAGIFSDGCTRISTSCYTENTTFLNLRRMKAINPDKEVTAETEAECKFTCLQNKGCSLCQAYSYNASRWSDRTNSSICMIWTEDLPTLEEENTDGLDLSVPVQHSDIASTARTCKPCGTNIIPYPLSTGPDCGDPMYSRFNCSYDTGKLSVMMIGGYYGNYRVTQMDPGARKFYVQIPNLNCDPSQQREPSDSPFNVTYWCVDHTTIEVIWKPPQEPLCNKSIDCKDWPHSTCNATTEGKSRCLCDSKFQWDGLKLNCSATIEAYSGDHSTKRVSLTFVVILTIIIFMASTIVFAYVWKRKVAHNQDIGSIQRIQASLHDSERQVKGLIGLGGLEEKDGEGIDLPYFDFESILAATDNFSDAHKLGQGGYGPVYKGKFPGGQDMAVKRLSSVSSQGLQEFKNEVVLIAKLQHRNLVRLQGYCIKGDEKILLYEYMPNKSLDSIIFDRTQRILLDWEMRLDIIIGIARGLLYLHQDSRLRVIHRDLKTSNILLDEEMKPKISDFGLARIFEGKETEANTERVVGTYGYMSPEYALDGFFSIKSDVFSFGVVLLEIISAKKNTGFYKSRQASSLLGYAWTLWADNKLLDLMDPSLSETCNTNQFLRCAIVGLLCVQDEPSDRPTMSNVLTMLDSEAMTLPIPKQPTFFTSRGLYSTGSSSSKPETSLQIDSSYQEGR